MAKLAESGYPHIMQVSPKTSVLIADGLPLFREGVGCILRASGRYVVQAMAEDGESALEGIRAIVPDLALLDASLLRLHTMEVVRRVQIQGLKTRIVVLSHRGDRKLVMEALRVGVSGFVLKTATPAVLLDALAQVASGAVSVSPGLEVDKILSHRAESTDPLDTLSTREYQVFTLLIEGVRAKEIARRLSLSPKTVDTYRASLMRKLEIYDVPGLVKYAIQRDLATLA